MKHSLDSLDGLLSLPHPSGCGVGYAAGRAKLLHTLLDAAQRYIITPKAEDAFLRHLAIECVPPLGIMTPNEARKVALFAANLLSKRNVNVTRMKALSTSISLNSTTQSKEQLNEYLPTRPEMASRHRPQP